MDGTTANTVKNVTVLIFLYSIHNCCI